MAAILAKELPEIEWLSLADFPGAPEPEETGDTYRENALIKARSGAASTGEWALADDAGLEIDALPGDLGVQSKRFAGAETTFPEKIALVLEKLRGVPTEKRTARFQCFSALAPPPGVGLEGDWPRVLSASCEGRIAEEPKGEGGFGYDPVFYLPELGRTMAQLTAEEKSRVSHRGKVLRAFAEFVRRI
ncbi:MAG: non-canonical purine NTP pyrophosphatase [Fimbriimonadaceae bacterium]|nr:non-canonical purine NTP pyrophosphatase [Fimbriimonadaceae bacterium]QYK55447.1 MAG: non-canonical purine NTP pyrophosphatase [Fimbriimonadaceae bacterium]